jgi:hypothetical protein
VFNRFCRNAGLVIGNREAVFVSPKSVADGRRLQGLERGTLVVLDEVYNTYRPYPDGFINQLSLFEARPNVQSISENGFIERYT